MRFSLLHILYVGVFAPITVVGVYNCLDLPNVFTKEDLDAIKVDCENAAILGSTIYPSATWIIHGTFAKIKLLTGKKKRYFDWIAGDGKTPWRELRRICVVTLGGFSGFGIKQRQIFKYASGNCGGSYPVDYASSYNFIDIGSGKYGEYHDEPELKYPPHAMVENGQDVPSDQPNVLHIATRSADGDRGVKGLNHQHFFYNF